MKYDEHKRTDWWRVLALANILVVFGGYFLVFGRLPSDFNDLSGIVKVNTGRLSVLERGFDSHCSAQVERLNAGRDRVERLEQALGECCGYRRGK
jgi:hypothetical protein